VRRAGAASAADRVLLGLVDGAQIRTIDDIVAEESYKKRQTRLFE